MYSNSSLGSHLKKTPMFSTSAVRNRADRIARQRVGRGHPASCFNSLSIYRRTAGSNQGATVTLMT